MDKWVVLAPNDPCIANRLHELAEFKDGFINHEFMGKSLSLSRFSGLGRLTPDLHLKLLWISDISVPNLGTEQTYTWITYTLPEIETSLTQILKDTSVLRTT